MNNRVFTGCLVISIAFLIPFGLLTGATFLGLTASGFIPPQIVNVRINIQPAPVPVDQISNLELQISNLAGSAQHLRSIDISDSHLAGVSVQSSLPAFSEVLKLPDSSSYLFNEEIPAGEMLVVTFKVLGVKSGDFPGWIRVCINIEHSCLGFEGTITVGEAGETTVFGDARSFNQQGMENRRVGAYDRAVEDFRQAIELDPEYAPAYNNLAWTLAYDLGRDYQEALQLAQQAVVLNGNANNHDTLALVYFKLEDFARALQHYDVAISIDPDHISSFRGRGDVYLALGETEAAVEDYLQYLSLAPAGPERETIKTLVEGLTE